MEHLLQGKVALITGAARGIGKATAFKYAEQGADLIIWDVNHNLLQSTAKELKSLGVKVLDITVDVTSYEGIDKAFKQSVSIFSQIHILANCAGVSTSKKLLDVDLKEWDWVFDINLKSVFYISQLVAKNMVDHKYPGKIVSISSQASKIGEYGNGVYCISKAGINMFTQVLGLELAEYGITVNAVCPGYVRTEMMQEVFQKRGPIEGMTPQQYEESLTAQVPMKKMAEPAQIAEFIYYLSSPQSDYITGVSLTIAGGKTLI